MTTESRQLTHPDDLTTIALLELVGRLALVIAAFLYGLGFLVTTIHLARYGYFAVSLLDRRYALAGFWAVAPLLLFWVIEWLVESSNRMRSDRSTRHWSKWVRVSVSMLSYVLLFATFQTAFAQLLGVSLSWLWFVFIYSSGLLFMLATRKANARLKEMTRDQVLADTGNHTRAGTTGQLARAVLAEIDWMWVPVCVTVLVAFTHLLYPKIPASWGGGGPERVQLLVPESEAQSLSTVGIWVKGNQLSVPVLLVASTVDDYVLVADSSRVAFMRRDLVRAIVIEGRFVVPSALTHSNRTVVTP